MLRYILKRILLAIPVMIFVSIIVFSLIHLAPGDPIEILMGIFGDPERIDKLQQQLHLDKPIVTQYLLWIKGVFKGDLGFSIRTGVPVIELIKERLPRTLLLTTAGLSISILFSIIAGVIAAAKRNSGVDVFVMSVAIVGISIPEFLMAILLILIFSVQLHLLPSMGFVAFSENGFLAFKHLILPALSLAIIQASITARMTRSEMLEVLGQDYIKTARAKGLREGPVIFKHALKNAFVPIITVIGVQFAFLMGGTVVIEEIFVYPGLGKLVLDAISSRDYTVVQGVVLFTSMFFIIINLIIDIIYTVLNPKIQLES